MPIRVNGEMDDAAVSPADLEPDDDPRDVIANQRHGLKISVEEYRTVGLGKHGRGFPGISENTYRMERYAIGIHGGRGVVHGDREMPLRGAYLNDDLRPRAPGTAAPRAWSDDQPWVKRRAG
jgi:hypothetical protein